KRALLLLVVLVLAVGTIPAGFVAYGLLARALDEQVRESLSMAPDLLATRWSATVDVRMMHARDVARTPGLAEALMGGDDLRATRIVEQAGAGFPEAPLLVGRDGSALIPADSLPPELLAATRRGEMPVTVVPGSGSVSVVSLAPVEMDGTWVGAVGGTSVIDAEEATALAGLTRSEVLILDGTGGVVGSATSSADPQTLADGVAIPGDSGLVGVGNEADSHEIREVRVGATRYLVLTTAMAPGSEVLFLKDLERELAVLPLLRRIALWSAGITLGLALILGTVFAGRLARPVGSLATAAGRLAGGDFDAPLEPSGISEVSQVSDSFDQMRRALRSRLAELEEANRRLEEANRELADRQERLMVLQTELVQRDRLASQGRLLAQLAHEIRNPIASIRNCLEVLSRRTADEPEAQKFADMAIDELLRMHELTEQMLDVHRPRDTENSSCEVVAVAQEVASLLRAGTEPGKTLNVSVVGSSSPNARVAPDSLKQVLLNLGLNAREAMKDEGPMEIVVSSEGGKVILEVLDRGPGVPPEILPRIFDPFFTTKSQVQGVGLGLFTAEAIVRTYGGRIGGANREDGPGARFTVEFPEADGTGGGHGSRAEERPPNE
ncbi:MAG: HAMP domain-containing protein, partial [Gemmatimonadetes bacterium]|nr:HAMP domain-containing protein [Gemmatimonadota bacterium]